MNIKVNRKNMFYGAKGEIFEAASILRKNMTLPELVLWNKLKDKKIFKFKFRRQHPINIFIVDFYCHEIKLIIEVDGEIHSDELISEYDSGRTSDLEKYGLRIIRFSNNQILFNLESVISRILKEIRVLAPL